MKFDFARKTYVMGILNVTPDSFSDGGQFVSVEQALTHAKQLAADGADIIDVGGESTRPGHEQISEEEEIARIVPVIRLLKENLDVPVSIDTYKSEVAKAALEAGADIVNDIWGAKYDPEIAGVAATYDVPIVLMHNREQAIYEDFWKDVQQDIEGSIGIARNAGVKREKIWLDPGIGFGKTAVHNIEMMQLLDRFCLIGYPVLLGTSRKSFIGKALGGVPVSDRLEGSLATACFGAEKGCGIIRVHDVKETVRAIRMIDVLTGKRSLEEGE